MALPDVRVTVRDGGLGISRQNDTGVPAFIGASSSGTDNEVNSWTDAQTMRDELGSGPLVEAAALALAIAGGPVVTVKTPSSTAGAAGSVTATKTGTATLAVTGASLDAYDVIVTIVQGGATIAAGAATFSYSLDGGRTESAEIAMPTSGVYVIPGTGLTLTWTYVSGTAFVAGDKWTFTATGPSYTLNEATTAMDALIADTSVSPFLVHIVGPASTPSAAATMFAAVDSKLESAANSSFRYMRGIIETPDDTDANLKAAFLASAGKRTMVSGGWAYVTSQISAVAYLRPAAWVVTARAAAVPPPEDLGEVLTGPVAGIVSLKRDEFKTPGLDAAGFVTLRTYANEPGFYVTQGMVKTAPGSDFSLLQNGRVVDIACYAIRAGQLRFINSTVRVSKTTGKMLEVDVRNVEQSLEQQVRNATTAKGYASDLSVVIDRDADVLATSEITVRYRIVPFAYLKYINGDLGLTNPKLVQVAA